MKKYRLLYLPYIPYIPRVLDQGNMLRGHDCRLSAATCPCLPQFRCQIRCQIILFVVNYTPRSAERHLVHSTYLSIRSALSASLLAVRVSHGSGHPGDGDEAPWRIRPSLPHVANTLIARPTAACFHGALRSSASSVHSQEQLCLAWGCGAAAWWENWWDHLHKEKGRTREGPALDGPGEAGGD